ncbi:MAG: hypothetical protein M3N57_01655 [Actinomycetota bacterium]|nr:hypothetical protein [Actinomycetota bacterium]
MLGQVEANGRTVVADFEAGIGTLSRMSPGYVDTVLVVVEPNPKSIEVGTRAAGLARDKQLGSVVVVANRVRDDDDLARIRDAFGDRQQLVAVPDDPVIITADREGVAPIDLDPHAPAVRALAGLVETLAGGGHAVSSG